ncbi:FAD:protein FMN transferase [Acidobacteriota bacterium]
MALQEVRHVFTKIETHFPPDSKDLSSPIVLSLYHSALHVYLESEGCFDITVASLSKTWGFFDKSYRLPSPSEIQAIVKTIGMDKIREEENALVLPPEISLDWGGIAKGLGIDLAVKALMEMGVSSGLINAGGDLFCWGENPDRQAWKVGIKHPRKNGFLGTLTGSNYGVATSGDYQRYFESKGIRYHHVFDPRTGYPARGKQSVTVIGPETLLCDALSTALFVSNNPEKIIDNFPGYGAVIQDSEGKIFMVGAPFSFQPAK